MAELIDNSLLTPFYNLLFITPPISILSPT